MNLFWHSKNSISIDSGEHSLMVEPLDLDKELRSAKAASVILLTHPQPNLKVPAKTNSFVVANPGEYDVKGFFIFGFGGFDPSADLGAGGDIAYTIETEGVRLCHLSVNKELTDAQLENLNSVDILFIDVGSSEDTNETAAKVVSQIEPRVVIPMGYDPAKKPMTFLKEMGASDTEPQNKLNIKKKDLPQEETKIILLNAVK